MKRAVRHRILALGLFALTGLSGARASDDFYDRIASALTFASVDARFRARVSGTIEFEGYALPQPSPGLLYTSGHALFNPRLVLFLDAQLGAHTYLFAQARVDRGFDPSSDAVSARLDEYALRFSLLSRPRLRLQVGKFATVMGNWVARHGAWENPFITAPLPYENLTAIWHSVAPRAPGQLLAWAHVRPSPVLDLEQTEKPLRVPLVWGPSYAHGVALAAVLGRFDVAAEVKTAPLSSRPDDWSAGRIQWSEPTYATRVGFRPDARWNLGLSASTGSFLQPEAMPSLVPDRTLANYRQTMVAADLGFAWHHWQLWAEVYTARFALPRIGKADTTAYYAEAKYKFTPRLAGALRWNQQLFANFGDGRGGRSVWGRELWRLDVAPSWRFNAQIQVKLQYSLEHAATAPTPTTHLGAAQITVRF